MTNNTQKKFLALVCMLMLSACNEHDKEKSGTQIVAKVNNEEISIHQLNYVLGRSNNITPDNAEQAKKKILAGLADVSVIYQQAVSEQLDRDADVMMAIEQSKRQTLAQSWLQKLTKSAPKPTANEVEVYYNEHPDLFAQHKTFKLKEVLVSKAEGKQTALTEAVSATSKIDDLLKKLDENKIPYQAKQVIQGAENLPLDQLPTLAGLKDGQFITFDKDNALLVLAVISYTVENVELAKATPIIEKYLTAKISRELVEKTVKELKDKAKIEYLGEFASLNGDKSAAAASSLPATAPAQPVVAPQPASQQP